MHNNKLKGNIYLLLTAILWGGGFIFQRWGGKHLSAFSFNAFRMIITSLTFLILYLITYKKNIEKENVLRSFESTFWEGSRIRCLLFMDSDEPEKQR